MMKYFLSSAAPPMKVAVLIPAYDEEASIAKVVIQSLGQADRVIVCDDGSRDMTTKIAERLGAEVILHERNLGYGATLSTLFARALRTDADIFVTLDADGQHDPGQIPTLVEPISTDRADLVVGSRFLGKGGGVPGYREVGIKVITNVSNRINDTALTDAQSGFRAYSRKALEAVLPADMGMGASTEILMKASQAGLRVAEVPISIAYKRGASRNPAYHGVEVLFSSLKHISILHPLVVYGIPGFVLLVYGLYLGSFQLRAYEVTHHVIVGSTLVAMGAVLVGLMLCITSLILWIMITLLRDPQYRNVRILGRISGSPLKAGLSSF
jgi:glycosyltransferase involved in cell wall biosynthesis